MTTLKSNLKLGKSIGSGHFGEVFLADDEVHGVVAVKVLERRPGETLIMWDTRKAGLLQEAQNLSKATHRNVVQVHHLVESETSDAILYVMEYCSGGSLQNMFENGPLSLSNVRKIATEVSFGLQALHSRGMLLACPPEN